MGSAYNGPMNDVQTEPFPLNDIQKGWQWGTYGKDGNGPLTHLYLHELETDHLINISRSQEHIYTSSGSFYAITIGQLLTNRGFNSATYLARCHELMKDTEPDHINELALTMARILVRFENMKRSQ